MSGYAVWEKMVQYNLSIYVKLTNNNAYEHLQIYITISADANLPSPPNRPLRSPKQLPASPKESLKVQPYFPRSLKVSPNPQPSFPRPREPF